MRPQPSYMPKLPTALDDIRTLLRTIDVTSMQRDVQREAEARLAVVGPVNSGKSTLFNLIAGKMLSPAGPVPGTTRSVIEQQIGSLGYENTAPQGTIFSFTLPAAPGLND